MSRVEQSSISPDKLFYKDVKIPDSIVRKKELVRDFVTHHNGLGHKIALVTSGGTTVPLESRTVRFIDNFSVGTRGSASAEYFLKRGYAVIFLHRLRSLMPFERHLQRCLLPMLQIKNSPDGASLTVREGHMSEILPVVQAYEETREKRMLQEVDFTTIGEYLSLLEACAISLATLKKQALLYLAAAVSDFYIPPDQMPEHKIQSAEGPLQLQLELVPKMLGPLTQQWAPEAFTVSFKLETNHTLLEDKARAALQRYQHKIVIGNILETRKTKVLLITRDSVKPIELSPDDLKAGKEIEEKIVSELTALHEEFCLS